MNILRAGTLCAALALIAMSASCNGDPAPSPSPERAEAGRAACHEFIDGFNLYPLVYLGDEFEGLPLVHCARSGAAATNPSITPSDQVVFVYGTCVLSGGDESSCVPPMQLHVYPSCAPIAPGYTSSGQSRGVNVTERDDRSEIGILAAAPGYQVKISVDFGDPATRLPTARRAFASLRGANPIAGAITSDAPLDALGASQPDCH